MVTASPPLTTHDSPLTASKRQPWKPNGDAHLIYHWVKMEGKSQGWVAGAFNISQPTVSRIVQRYERWQAHAKEREDGRLDPSERLRAQRCLTFERNELILTSCLRIANEMEGFIDTSRSTVSHPVRHPSRESEVRTEMFRVDRTGMTARFLRLAHRINMEQLKLAELAQPPLPPPLSDEELAEEERQAAADDAELAEARRRTKERVSADLAEHWKERRSDGTTEEQREGEIERQSDGETERRSDAPATNDAAEIIPSPVHAISPSLAPAVAPADSKEPACDHSPSHHSTAPLQNVHNLHNESAPDVAPTSNGLCTCGQQSRAEENFATCIIDTDQPSWPGDDEPPGAKRDLATAASRS